MKPSSGHWLGIFLGAILFIAISYGGSPFLCDCPFIKDGGVRIKDEGDAINHNGGWFNINLQTIKEGLEKMAAKYPKAWADFTAENDDAGTADTFLQCVCFGETIYA